MSFSFIHVSDIHLGRPFSGLSKFSVEDSILNVYKKAVEKSFNKMIDYAISKNVDFVLIAGDTFDSDESDFSSKLILKNGLKKLSDFGISVYLICGNHDPISSYSKNTFNFDENSKIKIVGLNTPTVAKLPILNKNCELVGYIRALSFSEEKFEENPLKYFDVLNDEDKKVFNIGLLHCDLNADSKSPYAPCSLSELKSFNYNYWALGHIHLPDKTENNICYTGTLQGRNTKETGIHGIRYVKVENNNIIKNSFVPMDVIRYEDIAVDISSANDSTEALNIIEDEIKSCTNSEESTCEIYLIRLNLFGFTSFYSEIDNSFFDVLSEKISNIPLKKIYLSQIENSLYPIVDEKMLQEDDGISGEIYKLVSDENVLKQVYDDVVSQFKNISVNENNEHFVINKAKEECLNLCSLIYSDFKEE